MHGLWSHIKFELNFKYILHIFGGKNRFFLLVILELVKLNLDLTPRHM